MLFCWNRMVGSIISLSIRWYFWHYHKAMVKIQSIQISILAGRVFIKNFTYIGSNETISILQGSFTWRYWLYKRRLSKYEEAELSANSEEPDISNNNWKNKKHIPARIKLAIEGVEWYIYNRSPAFDIIEENIKKATGTDTHPSSASVEKANPNNDKSSSFFSDYAEQAANIGALDDPDTESSSNDKPEIDDNASENSNENTQDSNARTIKYGKLGALISHLQSIKEVHSVGIDPPTNTEAKKPVHSDPHVPLTYGDSMMLKLLPIDLKITKGAVIVGNKTTPSLLVFRFESGLGYVDVDSSKNKLDKFKTLYHGDLVKPVLEMTANIDYEGNDNYKKEIQRMTQKFQFSKITVLVSQMYNTIYKYLQKLFKSKNADSNNSSNKTNSEPKPWKGLDRYKIDSDSDLRDVLQKEAALTGGYYPEYARVPTILDASEGSVTLYYDSPGLVPDNTPLLFEHEPTDSFDIGNCGSAPEWGVDLSFKDATIFYGPWADRQRVAIQHMLVPQSCLDATPQQHLKPGDTRVYTEFKVCINLDENAIVRIPLRETSKNNQFYNAHAEELKDKATDFYLIRPFGWFEITGVNLTDIYYSSAMIASETGWKTTLQLEIDQFEMRSSVNHALLYKAKKFGINADMSSPLKWNGLQTWTFDFDSYEVECFLMRDHIVLLTDLMSDFADGLSTPYDLFTPFIYKFKWNVHESYKIHLNINGHNIINNPLDFSENVYMIFQGDSLDVDVTIPLDQVFQKKNTISFHLATPRFDLNISSPPWNTLYSFLDNNGVGRAYSLDVKTSYTYYSTAEPGISDTLIFEVNADDVTLILYGFVINYILKVRENYFGEYTHFQTFEEFELSDSNIEGPKPEVFTYTKTDTDLDVLFYVFINNGSIVLPANIYSAESNILLSFASFDIDTRFTNYYMDLQANISPIKGAHHNTLDPLKLLDSARDAIVFDPIIFIDGIFIHGHRVFGLPPSEPTYFCKWDFDFGDVLLNGPLEFLQYLGRSVASIAYTYADTENGLLFPEPIIYDVTYLSLSVASLKVRLAVNDSILGATTSQISFKYNDLNNERYSARMTLSIPQVQVKVMKVNSEKGFDPKSGPSTSDENYDILAFINTSILLTDFIQKRDFDERREKQQEHIALHDAPFDRCSFLLDKENRVAHPKPMGNIIPSIPLPVVPPPLTKETVPIIDSNLTSSFGAEADDKNGTSVSSKSKYSFSESSGSSSDDEEDKSSRNGANFVKFNIGTSSFAGNAFMPPESWIKFEQISKAMNCKPTNFDLNPTSYYTSDDGIAPQQELDPDTEYDSFIIQLGKVSGFLIPDLIAAITDFTSLPSLPDLQSVMDLIQVDVLKRLNFIRTAQPEVKSFKIVIDSIDLKYGTVTGFDAADLMRRYESEISHVSAQCNSINLSLRITENNIPQNIAEFLKNGMHRAPSLLTAYAACEKILFSVFRGSSDRTDETLTPAQDSRPLFLQIDNPDIWWCETNTQNTGFFHLRNINFSILNESIPWIATFADSNIQAVNATKEKKTKSMSHTAQHQAAYVLSLLSAAGESFKVEDDPSVLTRPAYITRSKNHVRSNDSWKIIMRLRHILKSVPRNWTDKYDNIVKTNAYNIDLDAAQREVIRVFNKWRSWEMSGMDESYVFRHVFTAVSLQDTLLLKSASLNLDLESIALRINYLEDENFLCLDYLKISFGWKGKSHKASGDSDNQYYQQQYPNTPPQSAAFNKKEPLEVECTTNCNNVRLLLDPKILSTVKSVDKLAVDYKSRFFCHCSPPEETSAVQKRANTKNSENNQAAQKQVAEKDDTDLIPPIKVCATGCFQNISLIFHLVSVGLVYESRDIVFTGNVTRLEDLGTDILCDMSFVSHVKAIELSLREKFENNPERNLARVLLHDFKGSFACHDSLKNDTKYANFTHETFSVIVDAPIESLIHVGSNVLDNEFQVFKNFICCVEDNHKADVSHSSIVVPAEPKSLEKPQSRIENILSSMSVISRFNGKQTTIQFNATESLSLYLDMSDFMFVGTMRGMHKLACEISVTEQQLDLLAKNPQTMGAHQLFTIAIPSINTLVLHESSTFGNFVEIVTNIKSIESRVMPLSSLLLMMKSDTIDKEINSMIETVEKFANRISEMKPKALPANPVKKENMKKDDMIDKTYFNLTASVEETVVIFPSFDVSLALKLYGIKTTLTSFAYKLGTQFDLTPFLAYFSVTDAILDLRNDTWGAFSASEILRFQLSLSYNGRDEVTNKQRVEITSTLVHVILCQRIVEKLVNIANSLEEGISDFYPSKEVDASQTGPKSFNSSSFDESVKEQFTAFKNIGEKMILRMSLSDFCFAWLYEEEYIEGKLPVNPESKGMLFGYDSLQISMSNLTGKTLLRGVYITPTYDDEKIFSIPADKSQLMNTAYLPSVKMSYLADLTQSHPHLHLKLTGDQIRITILPSIVLIIFCLAKCVSSTVEACNKPSSPTSVSSNNAESKTGGPESLAPNPPSTGKTGKFSLPLSIGLSVSFAGASIIMHKELISSHGRRLSFRPYQFSPHNFDTTIGSKPTSPEPALSLQSPSIDAKIEYLKGDSTTVRDAFNVEILISSSTNKIYPTVVSSIVEMTKLIQTVIKEATSSSAIVSNINEKDGTFDYDSILASPAPDIDLNHQFRDIVVDMNIRIQRQELTLSCEPRAKVAATVAYDDFVISFNSFEDTMRKTTYGLSVRLYNFGFSLQHVYSREVSGHFSINNMFLFATMGRSSSGQQSILVVTKISDISTDVNLKQSEDIKLFQEIWSPENFPSATVSESSLATFSQLNDTIQEQINPTMLDGAIMRKYRRVTTTTAIPWCFDFCLMNVKGTIDLGQAVGQATFTLDKLWISSQKSSNWEQNMSLGFDEIQFASQGRFGGDVSLRKFRLSTEIMWQKHNDTIFPVPLVQATAGIEAVQARATFDYHTFAIVAIQSLHLSMYNQRDRNFVLNDRLAVAGNCESIRVYATSLSASNILDLYYAIDRMRSEVHASYDAILRDSATVNPENPGAKAKRNVQPFDRLRTFLNVNVEVLSINIFPDTLMDSQVFTVNVKGAEARYGQEIEIHESFDDMQMDEGKLSMTVTNKEYVSNLDMRLNGLLVALATNRKNHGNEDILSSMSVDEYIRKSQDAKGSTIIGIPLCEISMSTWQPVDTKVIDYIFKSSFGGRVDVGWNLGSVNFIRSMWENHVRTFNARLKTYEMRYAAGTSSSFKSFTNNDSSLLEPNIDAGRSSQDDKDHSDLGGQSSAPKNYVGSPLSAVVSNDSVTSVDSTASNTSSIATSTGPQTSDQSTIHARADLRSISNNLSPTTSLDPSVDTLSLEGYFDPGNATGNSTPDYGARNDVMSSEDGDRRFSTDVDLVSIISGSGLRTNTSSPAAKDDATTTTTPSGNDVGGFEPEASFIYVARVPPVIAQPQLRDMGEATPPVEWIGLHRKKLPSFIHQAIMVPLEKAVEEVDVVYRKVLGRS